MKKEIKGYVYIYARKPSTTFKLKYLNSTFRITRSRKAEEEIEKVWSNLDDSESYFYHVSSEEKPGEDPEDGWKAKKIQQFVWSWQHCHEGRFC